jgi:hypothetical protein
MSSRSRLPRLTWNDSGLPANNRPRKRRRPSLQSNRIRWARNAVDFLCSLAPPLVRLPVRRTAARSASLGRKVLCVEPLEQRTLLTTINLSTLGDDGVTIFGAATGDYSGTAGA